MTLSVLATQRHDEFWPTGGYRYDVWGLRRFASPKRNAIVVCFLQAARAETTDAVIEMQDNLITGVHNKARLRYDDLLHATEEGIDLSGFRQRNIKGGAVLNRAFRPHSTAVTMDNSLRRGEPNPAAFEPLLTSVDAGKHRTFILILRSKPTPLSFRN